MNDRYLFKAKRKNWKELWQEDWWVTGYYVFCRKRHYILPIVSETAGYDERFKEWVEIDVTTLCQYTGLLDNEKNMIWENDIVKASCSEELCAVGKVEQNIDGTWIMYPACRNGEMWYLLPDEKGHTTVEVSGNIFDDSELLEE